MFSCTKSVRDGGLGQLYRKTRLDDRDPDPVALEEMEEWCMMTGRLISRTCSPDLEYNRKQTRMLLNTKDYRKVAL